jgi:2-amino-4-hydroxy-6-hydroxymethyldihydropteridine diphosphokinase
MNRAYILLGTNLGDRTANLATAYARLNKLCGTLIQRSSVYETAPWGVTNQPSFLNSVVCLDTLHTADRLLDLLLQIEQEMGRVRKQKWGERIIDLDILYFNRAIIPAPSLTVPHPALHLRRFTLQPLCEIAPDFIHPVFNVSNGQLLQRCPDHSFVAKLDLLL